MPSGKYFHRSAIAPAGKLNLRCIGVNGALTLVAVALLTGSSWTLGTLALSWMAWPELRVYQRAALRLTAGLGLTALVLALAALTDWFSHVTAVLGTLAAMGVALALRDAARACRAVPSPHSKVAPWVRATFVAVGVCAGLACLGAMAPVTDDDALAYVVPIARHISETGAVRVWADQARSMWPQSQQVLLAYVLHLGGDRLGAITALEWLLVVGVVSALARRVCERSEHIGAALIIALGAPVVAFQVASAKEDLLLLAASAATAFCSGRQRCACGVGGSGAVRRDCRKREVSGHRNRRRSHCVAHRQST